VQQQRKKIRAQIDHRIQLEAPVIFRLEGLGLRHRCDLERVERGASTAEDIHCNGTCVKSTRIVDMALYTDKDITKTAMTIHEMEFACFFFFFFFPPKFMEILLKEARVTFHYGIGLVGPVPPREPSFH